MVEWSGDTWFKPELKRLAGEMLIAAGSAGRAEPHFARALAIARDQSAKTWELRVAVADGGILCVSSCSQRSVSAGVIIGFVLGTGARPITHTVRTHGIGPRKPRIQTTSCRGSWLGADQKDWHRRNAGPGDRRASFSAACSGGSAGSQCAPRKRRPVTFRRHRKRARRAVAP